MTLDEAFRFQAFHCGNLGSPFMVRLMELFADRLERGSAVAELLLDWPGDPSPGVDAVPLRFAGALHALKLQGKALANVYPPNDVSDDALWEAMTKAMQEHEAQILHWMRSAPQTNEVRRASIVVPALAMLQNRFARPLSVLELGCSGGLNLRADRFALDAAGAGLGPEDALVRLSPDWRGPAPVADRAEVVARAGVDLNPLDPQNAEDRLRLLAYLWPDQPDRIARTEAAIEEARRTPAEVSRGDAGDWLVKKLPERPAGVTTLIYHTIAWQYFPPDTVEKAEAAIDAAAESASEDNPLAHLSMEGDGGEGAAVTLTTWPGGAPELIARVDFHGRWVDWRAG